jgi:hypothetical protein
MAPGVVPVMAAASAMLLPLILVRMSASRWAGGSRDSASSAAWTRSGSGPVCCCSAGGAPSASGAPSIAAGMSGRWPSPEGTRTRARRRRRASSRNVRRAIANSHGIGSAPRTYAERARWTLRKVC